MSEELHYFKLYQIFKVNHILLCNVRKQSEFWYNLLYFDCIYHLQCMFMFLVNYLKLIFQCIQYQSNPTLQKVNQTKPWKKASRHIFSCIFWCFAFGFTFVLDACYIFIDFYCMVLIYHI